jgi:hypothetical protein
MFFAMLRRGRDLKFKSDSRKYYELCKVARVPHFDKKGIDMVTSWFWDNSLTDLQIAAREDRIAQVKDDAKKHYAPTDSVLGFFAPGIKR